MKQVLVLVEQRRGEIREITEEMLSKGRELAEIAEAELTAVILGNNVKDFAQRLARLANRVIVVEDEKLTNFNSEIYQRVLVPIIEEEKSDLVLIGHTSFGMDLAPSLAAELNMPLATDCIDLKLDGERLLAIRPVHGDKVNTSISFSRPAPYVVTIRSGSFPIQEYDLSGEITYHDFSIGEVKYKKFLEYVEPLVGEVDITKADILVGVGRGIGDGEKNLPIVEDLAKALGGVVACSRPVVDKKWLPADRQVGTSGKTVKPKVYIAVGISGAFQHISGMKGADTIIAINKDPKAPIFGVADYGIVDDLFKVVPALASKIREITAT